MAALPPLGAPAVDTSREAVAEACAVLARDLPRLGVRASDNALAELRDLAVTLDVSLPASGYVRHGPPGACFRTSDGRVAGRYPPVSRPVRLRP